jgi:hypothetical protein
MLRVQGIMCAYGLLILQLLCLAAASLALCPGALTLSITTRWGIGHSHQV